MHAIYCKYELAALQWHCRSAAEPETARCIQSVMSHCTLTLRGVTGSGGWKGLTADHRVGGAGSHVSTCDQLYR